MAKSVQNTVLLGQFLMILAMEMTNPFLALLIETQNPGSAIFYSMLSLILPMVAHILMAPVWGLIADRYGYKPMLMRACWALVLVQTSMIFVSSLKWILVVRILQGAFAGFIVAMQTYTLSISTWESKSRQLSRLQSSKAIATAVAGLIGGLVLTLTHFKGLYSVAAFICAATALMMQFQLPSSAKTNSKNRIKNTNNTNNSQSIFYFLCLLITLTQIAKFIPDPGLTLYLNQFFTNNMALIGVLYSLPALGMLASSARCGRQFDRCRHNPALVNRYLIQYSVLGFLVMLTQSIISDVYLFTCLRILWGVVLTALLPALFALFSDRYLLPGYALGIANSFAKLGNLIGLLLGGLLASHLPYQSVFLVIAAVYGLFAVFVACYHWMNTKQAIYFSNPFVDNPS